VQRGPDGVERRLRERRTRAVLDQALQHDSHVFLSLP
jgi:hypothetical protein